MLLKSLSLAVVVSALAGCATHDPRDAPWDPPAGRSLFEQLPAWDRAAERQCCAWRTNCEERGLSRRC